MTLEDRIRVWPDHATWLIDRRDTAGARIGGSDVPAILGASRFRGPWDLWADRHMPGTPKPEPDYDDPQSGGTALEPAMLQLYAERTGREVDTRKLTIRHPEHEWAVASVDGLVWVSDDDGPGLVEVKTIGTSDGWADVGDDGTEIDLGSQPMDGCGVPVEYLCQIAYYLACVPETAWCDCLVGRRSYSPQAVAVDAEGRVLRGAWTISEMRVLRVWRWDVSPLVARIAAWRERHLIQGIEPDPDASAACIRAMLATPRRGERPATTDEVEMVRHYAAAKAAAESATAEKEGLRARLLAAMRPHKTLTAAGSRVVWLHGSGLRTNITE